MRLYFRKLVGETVAAVLLLPLLCPKADAQVPRADTMQIVLSHEKGDTGRARKLIRLSVASKGTNVPKAFYYATEALELSQKARWQEGKMYAEGLLGECYDRVGAFHDAITHFKAALAVTMQLDRPAEEARYTQLMLHSYHMLNDMNAVLACQQSMVGLAERSGDPVNLCAQMRSYGLFLSEAGKYGAAIQWLNNAAAFASSHFTGDVKKDKVADILNVLAGAYLKVSRKDSALNALRTAMQLVQQTHDERELSYVNSTICDVYTEFKNYDSAIIYGERTVKMGEAQQNIDIQQYYSKVLSHVYEWKGNAWRALYYHKRYDSLINLINNAQKAIDQVLALSKVDIEEQTDQAKRERKSFETIRRNQEIALGTAFLAIVALVTFTIYIYRNLRQKQRSNRTIGRQAASLKQQNDVIDRALREKEILLKETHHRVKNNLQLISSLLELQAASYDDDRTKSALKTAQRRVQSIAVVHNKLYGTDDSSEIDLHAFADDLFKQLSNAYSGESGQVSFENTIPATIFSLNKVVLLGLILNELITNSFKHGFKRGKDGILRIGLEFTGSMYTLRYFDNGAGMQEEQFTTDTGSLGLYLIKRLSKQLKGMVTYKNGNGSIFTIIFPQ